MGCARPLPIPAGSRGFAFTRIEAAPSEYLIDPRVAEMMRGVGYGGHQLPEQVDFLSQRLISPAGGG